MINTIRKNRLPNNYSLQISKFKRKKSLDFWTWKQNLMTEHFLVCVFGRKTFRLSKYAKRGRIQDFSLEGTPTLEESVNLISLFECSGNPYEIKEILVRREGTPPPLDPSLHKGRCFLIVLRRVQYGARQLYAITSFLIHKAYCLDM